MSYSKKFVVRLAKRYAHKIYITSSMGQPKVNVEGLDIVNLQVPNPFTREQVKGEIIKHYRDVPRKWLYWLAIFGMDPEAGEEFYKDTIYEIEGRPVDNDPKVYEKLVNFLSENEQGNETGYGLVAFPTNEVEIDDDAVSQFIDYFRPLRAFDPTVREDNRLMELLKSKVEQ